MIQDLKKRTEKHRPKDSRNVKQLEDVKNKRNNTIAEVKNTVEGIQQ